MLILDFGVGMGYKSNCNFDDSFEINFKILKNIGYVFGYFEYLMFGYILYEDEKDCILLKVIDIENRLLCLGIIS